MAGRMTRNDTSGYGADRMPARRIGLLVPLFVGLVVLGLLIAGATWLLGKEDDKPAAVATTVTVDATPTATESTTGLAPQTSQSVPNAPGEGTMTAQQAADAKCITPAGDASRVIAPPVGATWTQVDGHWVPSTSAGPSIVGGTVRRCYAHTHEGAILAMYSVPYFAVSSTDAALVRKVSMTDGPARTELASHTEPPDLTKATQIIAFRTLSYSPAKATFEIVQDYQGEQLRYQTQLVWADGDWKMDGNFDPPSPNAERITDKTGWIEWRWGN